MRQAGIAVKARLWTPLAPPPAYRLNIYIYAGARLRGGRGELHGFRVVVCDESLTLTLTPTLTLTLTLTLTRTRTLTLALTRCATRATTSRAQRLSRLRSGCSYRCSNHGASPHPNPDPNPNPNPNPSLISPHPNPDPSPNPNPNPSLTLTLPPAPTPAPTPTPTLTKVLLPLLRRAAVALLLSGTPALSRPYELWTQASDSPLTTYHSPLTTYR